MASRRDYQQLADALVISRPERDDFMSDTAFNAAVHQWLNTRGEIMGALSRLPGNFDRDRFAAWCDDQSKADAISRY